MSRHSSPSHGSSAQESNFSVHKQGSIVAERPYDPLITFDGHPHNGNIEMGEHTSGQPEAATGQLVDLADIFVMNEMKQTGGDHTGPNGAIQPAGNKDQLVSI